MNAQQRQTVQPVSLPGLGLVCRSPGCPQVAQATPFRAASSAAYISVIVGRGLVESFVMRPI